MNTLPTNFSSSNLANFLDESSASTYWKSKEGRYLGVNEIFLNCNAMSSDQDVIGKTDLDLIWNQQAPILMKNDQAVILSEKAKTVIEPVLNLNGKIDYCLSHKSPLRTSSGKVVGVFGLSFIMTSENSIFTALNELGTLVSPLDADKLAGSTKILTKRQSDCLYYLIKGFTIKEIGKKLLLSPKTVENYLTIIKSKLECKNRAELIAKGLNIPSIKYR